MFGIIKLILYLCIVDILCYLYNKLLRLQWIFILKKEEDYLKVYLVGAGSVFINIITLFFFKEEPFTYGRKDLDPLVEDVSIVKDILQNTENKPIDVSGDVEKPQE